MDTRKMLAKAIKQHPNLLPFPLDKWPEGLQEQIQAKIKHSRRSQGISTHTCLPFAGQLLKSFWRFAKKELNYGVPNLLPDNGISITQLWLRYLMLVNYEERWNWRINDWEKGDQDGPKT